MKCIAIGNRIMGDDAVGIKVLEELEVPLSEHNIDVIYCETDNDYALSQIKDNDFIIIIDATFLNKKPGEVTITPIGENKKRKEVYSAHEPNLIDLLQLYNLSVNGYIVGIEVEKIDYSLELSEQLIKVFKEVCDEILAFILHLKEE